MATQLAYSISRLAVYKEERELYEGHLKWMRIEESTLERAKTEGLEVGLAKGKEEGKTEAKKAIARLLLAQGMELEAVCKITGMAKEELIEGSLV